jgi:hypothetical protein
MSKRTCIFIYMKQKLLSLISLVLLCYFPFTTFAKEILTTGTLTCEYANNPLGVASKTPRLGWIIDATQRNTQQIAWQILVADNQASLDKNIGNIWDSKKVASNQSIQILYKGKALKPAITYHWKVKIWDNHGNVSFWSKPAMWRMGLLNSSDWLGAKWIAYEELPAAERIVPAVHLRGDYTPKNDILPLFRRNFSIKRKLKSATAFISGLGHFDLSINGSKVGDHILDAGWTEYDKHALYVTFDLTDKLKKGDNTIGVILGNGFYFIPRDDRYRKLTGAYGFPKLICRVLLEYSDGSSENIISDEQWKTSPSPITSTSIYGGEDYNATLEQKDWDKPVFNDAKWKNAIIVQGSPVLNSQTAEPVKLFETFAPVKISSPKPGIWVYDMGQNASAIPAIETNGKKGAVLRITPAELLNPDGTVNQSASGVPHYYDYTLKGDGNEKWQPRFTYYGFRYLQVEGAIPEKEENPNNLPVLTSLKSLHLRNAAENIGNFNSSNELFNKTFKLIDWAIKSNMVSVFTDCPHREKLGWLEEAHLMGGSVQYNYNIASLCRKIVKDMIAAQTKEGLIPDIAPEYTHFDGGFRDSPEWGSSGVIVPWYAYKWYGDKDVLEESYPMMQKYVAYLSSKATNYMLDHGLGDWYDIGPNSPGEAQLTPKKLTATAIYYYDIDIITKVARLLGKTDDAKKYEELALQVKSAFNATFFNKETKQYSTGSQTAYAMAVYMNLVDPEYKDSVIANLVKEIKGRKNSLTAGDIGYRYVLKVLDDAGRSDVIYDMNSKSDVPGYGWQLEHGATALTESWQAYGFVSNNHFMLGHLMEWLYSGLGGIKADEDAIAYDKLQIKPEQVGNITHARASYKTPYGKVVSDWNKTENNFELKVEVPVNSKATIYIPASENTKIYEGETLIKNSKELVFKGINKGFALLEIGSGNYVFKAVD